MFQQRLKALLPESRPRPLLLCSHDSEATFAVDRNARTVNPHVSEAVRDKAAALDVIFFPLLLGEWE